MISPKIGRWLLAISFVPLYFLVQRLREYPEFIETYYSNGFYRFWSQGIRYVLGRFPISIGDLLYIVVIVWGFIRIRKHFKGKTPVRSLLLFVGTAVSLLYLLFNLSWGLNYHRISLQKSLELNTTSKDSMALFNLTKDLILRANTLQLKLANDTKNGVSVPYTTKEILEKGIQGYKVLEKKYPSLTYHHEAVKKSLFAWPLSYMGYAGYLNPFTLEAQVNQKIPAYRLPVVATHEMAHQLGYASERDTNFIGYLAGIHHPDQYFNYASTTLALSYCLRDVYRESPKRQQEFIALLNPGVLKNFQESNRFWETYQNPLSPYFESIFNRFLKMNNQAQGVKSYGQIVQLLLAYHAQYPL